MEQYVTLKDLAEEIGLDRSNMRKYLIRQGFEMAMVRTPESRSQMTLAITVEDAEAVKQLRNSQGFGFDRAPIQVNGYGFFYIIQVVPDLDPLRVKLGFATNMDSRLAAHRTSAPTARLVKHWPCKAMWEGVAIASITRSGCNLVGSEVFACDDIAGLSARGDAFFAIMPSA
jgi:hypothetical protein